MKKLNQSEKYLIEMISCIVKIEEVIFDEKKIY